VQPLPTPAPTGANPRGVRKRVWARRAPRDGIVHTFSARRYLSGFAVLLALGAILVAAAACGGDGDDDDTPTPSGGSPTASATSGVSPTASATSDPGDSTYPDDTRTNIPSVDAVIDRVLAGDVDSLKLQVSYTEMRCETNPQGAGAPPKCEAGEQEGDMVEVFPAAMCEMGFGRPPQVDQVLEQLVEGGPKLYAVYRVNEEVGPLPAEGHGVVFLAPDNHARTVRVTNDGIIAVFLGCNPDPDEALQGQDDFVLAPLD